MNRGMPPRILGLAGAIVILALGQGFKAWMLYGLGIAARPPVVLAPFLDLRMAWNTGISYSLFRADSPFGRAVLVGMALAAVAALSVWLVRTRKPLTATALGLLIGGALGNAWDRAVHGAVADFFHLHWGAFSPFGVFNIADVAITAGVGLLLLEALLSGNSAPNKQPLA